MLFMGKVTKFPAIFQFANCDKLPEGIIPVTDSRFLSFLGAIREVSSDMSGEAGGPLLCLWTFVYLYIFVERGAGEMLRAIFKGISWIEIYHY